MRAFFSSNGQINGRETSKAELARCELRTMAAVLLSAWLSGCGDCEDETAAAAHFLAAPANISCQSDADCEVVSTGCGHPARSLCSQAQLNHVAAASDGWKALQDALRDCDDSCSRCFALVTAKCTSGFCGGPP
ncbi:MAG TPA: hypothetical protein VFK05_04965 [Polyangiaceae bacterium]|nr:hypothetical protein [Polyangiaceae bacterium]